MKPIPYTISLQGGRNPIPAFNEGRVGNGRSTNQVWVHDFGQYALRATGRTKLRWSSKIQAGNRPRDL
jgi:hypothetical protein